MVLAKQSPVRPSPPHPDKLQLRYEIRSAYSVLIRAMAVSSPCFLHCGCYGPGNNTEARLEFRSRGALVQAMAQEQSGRTEAPIAGGRLLYFLRPFRPLWIVVCAMPNANDLLRAMQSQPSSSGSLCGQDRAKCRSRAMAADSRSMATVRRTWCFRLRSRSV